MTNTQEEVFMDKTQLINTNQQPQAELITTKELENWLGIKAIQQYHLRKNAFCRKKSNPPLPFYKISGLGIRYKRSEIIEWVNNQKRG